MKIGIVGAENSHTVAIARTLNVDRAVRGARVTHVWGETRPLARKAAEAGEIPNIVQRPTDLIGQVDGAVVDHRHPKFHLPAVWPLLEAGIPLFVDKPFCYRKAEGRRFLARAEQLGVPICSFSVLPHQESFLSLQKRVKSLGRLYAVVSTGPCDLRSKHGGIFFYGIHQVDMVLRLLGYEFHQVGIHKGKANNSLATVTWRNGSLATMHLIGSGPVPFHLSVIGEKGRLDQIIEFDENSYLTGIRRFVRVFKSGRSQESDVSMLGPVVVLEGLEKALKINRRVRVSM
jgi:predicted dehydrogenase